MPEDFEEGYPGQADEFRRQETIRKVVECADRIILDESDRSVEETDYLTVAVARAFVEKVYGRICSQLLREDLERRSAKFKK